MTNDRRNFIKQSTTVAASLSVIPSLMNASCAGANKRVVVGLIGCNNQGFVNLKSFLQQPDVICGAREITPSK